MENTDGSIKGVVGESILQSVKKLIGILPEQEEFDPEIIMHINAAITILTQLGIGPSTGYVVTSEDDTFEDFLGVDYPEVSQVKLYLGYKTQLGFDMPQSSYMIDTIKSFINEFEWRVNVHAELRRDEYEEEE